MTYLRISIYWLGVLALIVGFFASASYVFAQPADQIHVVTIDEEIRAGTVQFLERSLRIAEAEGAQALLIELNTPGGLLSATEDISRLLIDSPLETIVYLNKETGWAFSAGVFILFSADTTASQPTASLGAASPILSSGGDADEKTRNATVAWIESIAARAERDPELITSFVTENRTMSGQEAYELGLIDVLAISRSDLLEQLGYAEAVVIEQQPTVVDGLFSFFSIPYLVPLLLTIGSFGLLMAFRTGEIEVIGAVSFILLLLGLWGIGSIQLSTFGVIVLVLGISLIALEVFLGGSDFGISGVIGAVSLLLGIATFAQEPFFPDVFSYGLMPALVSGFVLILGLMLALSYFTASTVRQKHQVGVETMVGKSATVHRALNPQGVILYEGERYTARLTSEQTAVAEGVPVTIVAMEGNIAVVEPAV